LKVKLYLCLKQRRRMIRQTLGTGPFYPLGNVGSYIRSLNFKIFVKVIYTLLELEDPLKLRQIPNGPI
jgi:hypothetical protein